MHWTRGTETHPKGCYLTLKIQLVFTICTSRQRCHPRPCATEPPLPFKRPSNPSSHIFPVRSVPQRTSGQLTINSHQSIIGYIPEDLSYLSQTTRNSSEKENLLNHFFCSCFNDNAPSMLPTPTSAPTEIFYSGACKHHQFFLLEICIIVVVC